MKNLRKMTAVEMRLFFRETGTWIVAIILPTFILVVLGILFGSQGPDEAFGGQRFIDIYVPSLVVITLATLGVNTLPARLVSYREKGVLRRLSTTPVNPAALLIAQLVINMIVAVLAVILLIGVGYLAFRIPLPQHPFGFIMAFLFGMSSLFALGLLVAATAKTARASAAMIIPLFIVVMFLGGVYVPRMILPDFLVRLGEYVPPGVQALLDAWQGIPPQPAQLAILAVITLGAGLLAARLFRWE